MTTSGLYMQRPDSDGGAWMHDAPRQRTPPLHTKPSVAASPDPNIDIATMDRAELQDAVTRTYLSLSRKQMILLLGLRSLPTYGDPHQLAFRLAVHDLAHRTDLNSAPRTHTPPPRDFGPPPSARRNC